jgi:hypothetical protein
MLKTGIPAALASSSGCLTWAQSMPAMAMAPGFSEIAWRNAVA